MGTGSGAPTGVLAASSKFVLPGRGATPERSSTSTSTRSSPAHAASTSGP